MLIFVYHCSQIVLWSQRKALLLIKVLSCSSQIFFLVSCLQSNGKLAAMCRHLTSQHPSFFPFSFTLAHQTVSFTIYHPAKTCHHASKLIICSLGSNPWWQDKFLVLGFFSIFNLFNIRAVVGCWSSSTVVQQLFSLTLAEDVKRIFLLSSWKAWRQHQISVSVAAHCLPCQVIW